MVVPYLYQNNNAQKVEKIFLAESQMLGEDLEKPQFIRGLGGWGGKLPTHLSPTLSFPSHVLFAQAGSSLELLPLLATPEC